jgi:hypothetical protein
MIEAPPQPDILVELVQKPGIRRAFLFCNPETTSPRHLSRERVGSSEARCGGSPEARGGGSSEAGAGFSPHIKPGAKRLPRCRRPLSPAIQVCTEVQT